MLEGIRCHQEWQRSGARAKPENTPSGADSLGKFGVKRPREEASELQHSQGSRAHKKKDVKAPKRPRTGFVLFCNDMRGKLSTDNPGISFGDSGRRCVSQRALIRDLCTCARARLNQYRPPYTACQDRVNYGVPLMTLKNPNTTRWPTMTNRDT